MNADKFELKSEPAADPKLPLKQAAPALPPRPERRKRDSARLVWDSKPKRPPSPRDIEFQTAEVVIPNPARDAATLPFSFRDGILDNEQVDRSKMNRLIWGDNLLAMQALLTQQYEGCIDLIYIDPPFASAADYSHQLVIAGNEVHKEPSIIERLAYTDTWEGGIDSYLDRIYPALALMKRLLKDTGSIFVHLDWHVVHYVKVAMDEIFGVRPSSGNTAFRNEIIWCYTGPGSPGMAQFNRKHDNILWYTKHPENYHFFADSVRVPHHEKTQGNFKAGLSGSGFVADTYALPEGKIPEDWWEMAIAARYPVDGIRRTGYGNEKPWPLIERIIRSASKEGDLVADFFCGGGTTLAVSESLNRRWLGCDFGKVGIQVTRARLVQLDSKPFLIENIGNYQREMIYLTGGRIGEMQRIILKLYGATPHPNYKDLGVRKADDGVTELVYVGYPDRPTAAKKVEEFARLAESLDGAGYKRLVVLAWDYDYSYDEAWEARMKASKKPLKVDVQKKLIPPDVYDYLKKAKTEADIEKLADKIVFHEKPYLKLAKPKVGKKQDGQREVTLGIDRYVIFDLPVPDKEKEKLRELVKQNFAVLIDYWAVDWNYDGATFKSQWQAIRGNGRRATVVPTTVTEKIESGRKCSIAVRVVDVFGNDAAATVVIEA